MIFASLPWEMWVGIICAVVIFSILVASLAIIAKDSDDLDRKQRYEQLWKR